MKNNFMAVVAGVVGLALVASLAVSQIFAAQGNIYVAPASSSVNNGSNVSVNIRINTGGASVDGVEVYINYDQSKLQYVSTNPNTSAFPVDLDSSGGGGQVKIIRGNLSGGVSGDQLIASVTFKATADGTSPITLTSATNATSSGAYIDPTKSSGSVTVSTPDTGGDDGGNNGGDTGGNNSGNNGGNTGGNTGNNGGDTGGNNGGDTGGNNGGGGDSSGDNGGNQADKGIKTTPEPQFTKAIVKVSTNSRVRVYLEYGTSKDLGVSTSPKNIQGNGQFALEDLNPGTTIYYRIVRAGGGSNSRGSIKTFKTEGLTVVIKVVDRNNNPVRNQKVTLFSDPITTTTDDEGVATFEGVSPGEHEIAFNSDGEGERQTITVANNVESKIAQVNGESQVTESAAPQHFSVTYAGAGNNALIWYSTIIGLIALVIVGVVLFLKRRSGRGIGLNKFPPAGDSPQKAPVVGGTDKKTLDMLNKVQGEKPKEPGSVISPGGSNQNQNE